MKTITVCKFMQQVLQQLLPRYDYDTRFAAVFAMACFVAVAKPFTLSSAALPSFIRAVYSSSEAWTGLGPPRLATSAGALAKCIAAAGRVTAVSVTHGKVSANWSTLQAEGAFALPAGSSQRLPTVDAADDDGFALPSIGRSISSASSTPNDGGQSTITTGSEQQRPAASPLYADASVFIRALEGLSGSLLKQLQRHQMGDWRGTNKLPAAVLPIYQSTTTAPADPHTAAAVTEALRDQLSLREVTLLAASLLRAEAAAAPSSGCPQTRTLFEPGVTARRVTVAKKTRVPAASAAGASPHLREAVPGRMAHAERLLRLARGAFLRIAQQSCRSSALCNGSSEDLTRADTCVALLTSACESFAALTLEAPPVSDLALSRDDLLASALRGLRDGQETLGVAFASSHGHEDAFKFPATTSAVVSYSQRDKLLQQQLQGAAARLRASQLCLAVCACSSLAPPEEGPPGYVQRQGVKMLLLILQQRLLALQRTTAYSGYFTSEVSATELQAALSAAHRLGMAPHIVRPLQDLQQWLTQQQAYTV
ncbi:hypothetical protein cyc_08696 [Cyclospora cayetanensis]|uniref:Uncharacterized protein n=1 Tax=Cyclospora cayetanensis TaxID=88456 RepID=A0A1D3CSH2_9EIME|nr:hypothetical protein cyc_08696 [Cyclospora cayetanensis]